VKISKFTVKCLGCGKELTIYPRHIQHKEPIPCPECGRRNSVDEYDLTEQLQKDSQELLKLLKKTR